MPLTATMKSRRNRIIALAGIFHAAAMVQQLAWYGKFEEKLVCPILNSIFTIDANCIEEIYPDLSSLQCGLESLISLFAGNSKQIRQQEIARYSFALMHLERCLLKRNDLIQTIQKGLTRVKAQTAHFPLTHDNIMAHLASIYTDTVSTFAFRIHVSGEQNYLTNTNNVNKMRALLFAGIRAAVLWRQSGGNRWQLLFSRTQIVNDAKKLLAESK